MNEDIKVGSVLIRRSVNKRSRKPGAKLTPEQEAANEMEHNIRRGELPKW